MKGRIYRLILVSFLLIFKVNIMLGQAQERPKLGLVLSGGGAKGMAHIGVIKAMEEAGLYPDYITGTSMGSIIGGLYAMGYTADEIKEIALNINWDQILSNSVSLNKVAIEEKAFYDRYITEFPIKNKKIDLPQGVIDGQELTLMLNRLTRPAHGVTDFHRLPIPFECMGADVESGESVVLKSGSLPQALRASMAIPTVFTPVLIDDKLLVDGGLLRNFPVQQALDMGADIIIGVSVSSGLQSKEELNSMVDVLAQSAFVASAKDTEEQIELVDIYIEPDMSDYSTASFWSGPGIISEGEKSGQEFLPKFKKLADSLNQFGPVRLPEKVEVKDTYSFKNIEIVGNEIVSEALIKGKLQIEPNQPLHIDELEDRLNILYGTLYFSKVFYTIDESSQTLKVQVKEAPSGGLKLAVHFDTDNKAGINLNLTLRNLVLPSSRFIAELDLAENPIAGFKYFKYIGKKQNFAMLLTGDWIQSELPGYVLEDADNDLAATNDINNLLRDNVLRSSLGIQASYKTNSTVGLAIGFIDHKVSPLVMDSLDLAGFNFAFKKIVNKDWVAKFYYRTNTLNRPFFPTGGTLINLNFDYIFLRRSQALFDSNDLGELDINPEEEPLLISRFNFKQAISLTEKLTFQPEFGMTMSSGTSESLGDILYSTFIGGSRPTGMLVHSYEATPTKRFDLINYSYVSLALQWAIIKNLYFTARADYLESEYPMVWLDSDVYVGSLGAYPRRLGFSGKLSYNSPVGPVELGLGKDQYLQGVNVFFGFGYYIKDR